MKLTWYEELALKLARRSAREAKKANKPIWLPPCIHFHNEATKKTRIVVMTYWYAKAGLKHLTGLDNLNKYSI